jgi:hypothetical protein
MINQFFRGVRDIVTETPAFTFKGEVLQADPDYAHADGVQLEYEFVK